MKRILIAFDDSPGAEAAMRDMVRGGFPEKCEATVLTIADVWLPPETTDAGGTLPEGSASSRQAVHRQAHEALDKAREISVRGADRLRSLFPGWAIQHHACAESPAWGILAEARKRETELIVIGSHGRSPLERFFLGSVSYKVAAEAPCSVRIFKSHHRAADASVRVMIAVDGSRDADAAMSEALTRKWPTNTKFRLITILDAKIRSTAISDAGTSAGDESIRARLEERAECFRKRRFEASSRLVEGDPKSVLLHEAVTWDADCIFLGARGLEHRERLYLGTLASAITTRSHCTVEIVPLSAIRAMIII